MTLQAIADLCLLNGLLPGRSVFLPFFAVSNFASINFGLFRVLPSVFYRILNRFSLGLLLNTWLNFHLLSILLTWPIQFNKLIITNERWSKPSNICFNSSLRRFLQFSFTLITKTFFLKLLFKSKQPFYQYLYSLPNILLLISPLVLLMSCRFLFFCSDRWLTI
jgi:hypothetical protein